MSDSKSVIEEVLLRDSDHLAESSAPVRGVVVDVPSEEVVAVAQSHLLLSDAQQLEGVGVHLRAGLVDHQQTLLLRLLSLQVDEVFRGELEDLCVCSPIIEVGLCDAFVEQLQEVVHVGLHLAVFFDLQAVQCVWVRPGYS